jgi:branched-chain amino acid transport system ATP-binding protein
MIWKPRGFVGRVNRRPSSRSEGVSSEASPRRATADEPSGKHHDQRYPAPGRASDDAFGGLTAVNDLSFEAKRGDITALIGPNGAGKTTVFNCITGFYKPTMGMITLTQKSGKLSARAAARLPHLLEAKVARTFQNIRLFSGMTVLENLLVAQHNPLMRASGFTFSACSASAAIARRARRNSIEKARSGWTRSDLIDRADDPAGDLPYGDQRRLEIARAMCTEPELLCLDEPAAGLNPRESAVLNTAAALDPRR